MEGSMPKSKTPNQIWISPHEDGWAVKRAGNDRPSRVTTTKAEAEKIGRDQAKNSGSELITQRRNGTIQSSDSFGHDPNPPKDKEH
jgi:hypothetical protein